jgi:hypothetical protein
MSVKIKLKELKNIKINKKLIKFFCIQNKNDTTLKPLY